MKINICMGCMKKNEEGGACPYCGFDLASYSAEPHQLPPGTILYGKYLIGRVLGEGGFGITYVGMDLNLRMKIAVKEFFPAGYVARSSGEGESLVMLPGKRQEFYRRGQERFVEEARCLARFFGLPGVVTVKDFFQENNTAYIVMEFAEGKTLKTLLKENGGKMDAARVLRMMKPTMESLGQIHAAGLIHRDISPDNLMVDENDRMKLIDFGSARDYAATAEEQKSLTVMLKPGYTPEEQYKSRGRQGPWTDIYSLCATIYCAVTGEVPPESLDRMEEECLKRPSEYGAVLTKRQEDAIMKGLALYARDRYQDIRALMKDLYQEETKPPLSEESGNAVFGDAQRDSCAAPEEKAAAKAGAPKDEETPGQEPWKIPEENLSETERTATGSASEKTESAVSEKRADAPEKAGTGELSVDGSQAFQTKKDSADDGWITESGPGSVSKKGMLVFLTLGIVLVLILLLILFLTV